jgi:hypothetical protein
MRAVAAVGGLGVKPRSKEAQAGKSRGCAPVHRRPKFSPSSHSVDTHAHSFGLHRTSRTNPCWTASLLSLLRPSCYPVSSSDFPICLPGKEIPRANARQTWATAGSATHHICPRRTEPKHPRHWQAGIQRPRLQKEDTRAQTRTGVRTGSSVRRKDARQQDGLQPQADSIDGVLFWK